MCSLVKFSNNTKFRALQSAFHKINVEKMMVIFIQTSCVIDSYQTEAFLLLLLELVYDCTVYLQGCADIDFVLNILITLVTWLWVPAILVLHAE